MSFGGVGDVFKIDILLGYIDEFKIDLVTNLRWTGVYLLTNLRWI